MQTGPDVAKAQIFQCLLLWSAVKLLDYEPISNPQEYSKYCLDFLQNCMWIPLISCGILRNCLRIWSIQSASKNYQKMGFVPVDLTELLYFKNRSKFTLFHNLEQDYIKPSLIDGCHLTLLFETKIVHGISKYSYYLYVIMLQEQNQIHHFCRFIVTNFKGQS